MGVADSLDIIARAAAAADRPDPLTGQWALVSSITPLLVVLDGDATQTPRAVGANAAGPLEVGWRVWVLTQGRRLIVASAPAQIVALQSRLTALETGDYVYDPTYGHSLRLPDGTQVCWVRMSVTDQAISSAYGSLYQGVRTWSYARSFYGVPAVTCSEFKHGTGASWGTVSAVAANQADLRGIDAFSRATGTACAISATAIGRWK